MMYVPCTMYHTDYRFSVRILIDWYIEKPKTRSSRIFNFIEFLIRVVVYSNPVRITANLLQSAMINFWLHNSPAERGLPRIKTNLCCCAPPYLYRPLLVDAEEKLNARFCRIYTSRRIRLKNHTAKAVYRKFEINIYRNETEQPQSQFLHSCFCERFIYFHDWSAYSAAGK
jgi:hypothetical protein